MSPSLEYKTQVQSVICTCDFKVQWVVFSDV